MSDFTDRTKHLDIWCPHCHRPAVKYVWHEAGGCGYTNTNKSNEPHFHAMCHACLRDWIAPAHPVVKNEGKL